MDETEAAGAALTILLVEDNETDLFVIRQILQQSGIVHHVEIACDGQDALAFLQRAIGGGRDRRPGLLLLDLNIPRIPGLEVLRHIRNSTDYSDLPVIVITSSTSDADRGAAEALRANAYFPKPSDLESYMELGLVIRQVLGRGSAHGKA